MLNSYATISQVLEKCILRFLEEQFQEWWNFSSICSRKSLSTPKLLSYNFHRNNSQALLQTFFYGRIRDFSSSHCTESSKKSYISVSKKILKVLLFCFKFVLWIFQKTPSSFFKWIISRIHSRAIFDIASKNPSGFIPGNLLCNLLEIPQNLFFPMNFSSILFRDYSCSFYMHSSSNLSMNLQSFV